MNSFSAFRPWGLYTLANTLGENVIKVISGAHDMKRNCLLALTFLVVSCGGGGSESSSNIISEDEPGDGKNCEGLTLGFENLGAESVVSEGAFATLTIWEQISGNGKSVIYGQGGYPISNDVNQGRRLFYGGDASLSTLEQTVAVPANLIGCLYEFHAEVGGYAGQDDNATVELSFLSSTMDIIASSTLGPVSAFDRNNETTLLPLSTNGEIPIDAVEAKLTLRHEKKAGRSNDGYVDSIIILMQ